MPDALLDVLGVYGINGAFLGGLEAAPLTPEVVASAIVDKYIGESARIIREMFGYVAWSKGLEVGLGSCCFAFSGFMCSILFSRCS